jgi:hypothetical protein
MTAGVVMVVQVQYVVGVIDGRDGPSGISVNVRESVGGASDEDASLNYYGEGISKRDGTV